MSVCNGQNVLRVFLIKIASVAFLCLHSTQFSMNLITFQDTPHPGLFVVFFCGILLHKTSHYIYHMGSKVLRREDQL